MFSVTTTVVKNVVIYTSWNAIHSKHHRTKVRDGWDDGVCPFGFQPLGKKKNKIKIKHNKNSIFVFGIKALKVSSFCVEKGPIHCWSILMGAPLESWCIQMPCLSTFLLPWEKSGPLFIVLSIVIRGSFMPSRTWQQCTAFVSLHHPGGLLGWDTDKQRRSKWLMG